MKEQKMTTEINALLIRIERARGLIRGSEMKVEELQATMDATERYLREHRKPDDKRKSSTHPGQHDQRISGSP